MDVLDLARWQFGVTTIYHFFFVPITIGLSAIVAVLQTVWLIRKDDRYLRLTKFFGKLLVINFAMGIVTGLVQEFQFGMNWSAYSRFVGDVFGVPLAIEGLLAFFLESTFLGLWLFGWDRLPRWLHLTCIWLVAIGTQISAYVILAVNAWMQSPQGHILENRRLRLADIGELFGSETAVAAGLHTASASFLTGGAFVAGIAFWRLARAARRAKLSGDGVQAEQPEPAEKTEQPASAEQPENGGNAGKVASGERSIFKVAATWGSLVVLAATPAFVLTGDHQMKLMAQEQPMKVAAAEALFETEQPAAFSLFTIGTLDGRRELFSIKASHVLSFLAYGDVNAEVKGINELERTYAERYGPGSYVPNVPVTYWSFRLMIGFGFLAAAGALLGLYLLYRRPKWMRFRLVAWAAILLPLTPLAGNATGWLFTEGGRQPWLAFGLFKTEDGVSPETTAGMVALSLAVFTILYGVLAIVELFLLRRAALEQPAPSVPAAQS